MAPSAIRPPRLSSSTRGDSLRRRLRLIWLTDLENGDFATLQGKSVTTSGSGEDYKAGDASVVCGDVQTRNATVYIIDTVMMPPK
jgi:uncharacterized surface protein with fasciclin (FAS1) repeats